MNKLRLERIQKFIILDSFYQFLTASVNLTDLLDVFISLTSTQAATLLASFSHIGVIRTFVLGCIFSAVG